MSKVGRDVIVVATVTTIILILSFPVRALAEPTDCRTCHDAKTKGKSVHPPVAAGECTSCHKVLDAGKHPADKGTVVLVDKVGKLCFQCHEGVAVKKYVHGPVARGECVACHDPHQAVERSLLKKKVTALCIQCHENIIAHKYGHSPVVSGECLACHDPHQSDSPHQLKNQSIAQLCKSCHKKTRISGKTVHEPVKAGNCLVCHNPHGSSFSMALKNRSPVEFYLPYDAGNFALCFECHNRNIALDLQSDATTEFRDGYKNLHTLHVNRQVKGRTCKTCHDEHAANQAKLIKEKIPGFGKWEIPIGYTKTATGGTCTVGCHKPRSYDRFRDETAK